MARNEFLQPVDREYAAWLGDVERRVILPLKWILLALAMLHWSWSRDFAPPGTLAFGLFFLFASLTAAEQYFFARDRITPREVRPFLYASFLLDAAFVAALILADSLESTLAPGLTALSEYYPLFVLVVLRSFAVFRTRLENLFGLALVSSLFVALAWMEMRVVAVLQFLPALRELAIVGGMILIAQGFVSLVNVRREEELRTHERQLRSASLASLGELSAGVAHEINNPIGIIKTYAEYLEKSAAPDDPNRDDFETIRKEAERCQEIVRRMMDFANPTVEGFRELPVLDLVREVVGFVFHHPGEQPIEATVRLEGEAPPPVLGDAIQLRQALLNVLMNARQILEDEAREKPGAKQPQVEVVIGRGTGPRPPVRIDVLDNGPGISPQDAQRVFEPFFTRRRKGTGLGLAITRRILEAHQGTIALSPRHEGGTCVTIMLPIAGEEKA